MAMTNTPDKSELLPCRECGAPCSPELFPVHCGEPCDTTIWMCSQHRFLGGKCPSETAYLTKTAWNARASSRPADQVPDIRKALEDALAMLGAPTDGIETLGDRDIVKHTVAIQGWKLKQLHAALQAVPASREVGELRELLVEAQRHVADLAALPCEAVGPENAESCSCDPCRARSLNERIDFALKASGEE